MAMAYVVMACVVVMAGGPGSVSSPEPITDRILEFIIASYLMGKLQARHGYPRHASPLGPPRDDFIALRSLFIPSLFIEC